MKGGTPNETDQLLSRFIAPECRKVRQVVAVNERANTEGKLLLEINLLLQKKSIVCKIHFD